MPEDPSVSAVPVINQKLHNLESTDKPTIKILLYTDDPQEVVEETGLPFGLGSMINQINSHPLAFANVSLILKSRYPNRVAEPVKRIDALLTEEENETGEPFDEVWFFGIHQINKQTFRLGVGGGGPNSELDNNEISELRLRMNAGLGVLVTGDHANERPQDAQLNPGSACDDDAVRNQRFLGLGRALGRCIPRAGQLRDWEGDPTADPRHSFNTQVVTFGVNVDTETGFQEDATAQQLILQTFDEQGRPSRKGSPHALFLYREGKAIQLFPDHLHEGAATLPKRLDGDWQSTSNVQPKPRIVAYGIDKRNGRKLKLIAAYDGDMAGFGRIVADSTWHHYFNINLTEFPPKANPFTAADQIGQYYSNLALWLTPKQKRSRMAAAMSRWLTQQPVLGEVVGPMPSQQVADILATGRLARTMLTKVASDCEIHELLQFVVPDSYNRRYESLYFPQRGFQLSPLPSQELLVGSLIHTAPPEPIEMLSLDMFSEARLSFRRNAIANASELAFRKQKLRVAATARLAQKLFPNTTA